MSFNLKGKVFLVQVTGFRYTANYILVTFTLHKSLENKVTSNEFIISLILICFILIIKQIYYNYI